MSGGLSCVISAATDSSVLSLRAGLAGNFHPLCSCNGDSSPCPYKYSDRVKRICCVLKMYILILVHSMLRHNRG